MRYAMIMAGGAGTRLWPMSRKNLPKQLIPFIHQREGGPAAPPTAGAAPASAAPPSAGEPRSLLELAAARLEGLVPGANRYICTSESYRELIRQALPAFTDERILGEPVGRDTVNAVGFAAAVLAKHDPNAVFAVLTADHLIEPHATFAARMDLGYRLVEEDPRRLVTFAIKPTYAATGFGYVERGTPLRGHENETDGEGKPLAYTVARFVEKPDLPRAEAYFRSGHFGWNSGMFVWRASTFLNALKQFKPESHLGLMEIQKDWGTPAQQQTLARVYPTLPKISVDYAVMEPASKLKGDGREEKPLSVCTVQMDLTWLDVGSWPSYAQTLAPDPQGNRIAVSGGAEALLVDGRDNLVVSNHAGHLVAVLGASDLVIVHTRDATLVMPRERAEQLKDVHAKVDERLK